MPLLKNAQKALRASHRKAEINRRVKSRTKTMIGAMRGKPSVKGLATAFSAIDVAVKKKMVHKNKAARLKSQLSKLVPAGK